MVKKHNKYVSSQNKIKTKTIKQFQNILNIVTNVWNCLSKKNSQIIIDIISMKGLPEFSDVAVLESQSTANSNRLAGYIDFIMEQRFYI